MNPLVNIDVSICMEITGSELFGDDEGYMKTSLGGIKDINQITDEYLEAQLQATAKFCEVPRENVRLISKEEYDRETGEDDWDGCETYY